MPADQLTPEPLESVAERRQYCGGCGSAALESFLNLGISPVANDLPTAGNGLDVRYPLEVAVCSTCWLVQLLHVIPDELVFTDTYTFYSRTSPELVAYHHAQADELQHRYGYHELAVEIGCNDGSVLARLRYLHGRAVGVDPATGPVQVAQSHGLDARLGRFSLSYAQQLRDELGPAGLIVANNVLAHIADINDVMAGIAALLTSDGVAVIEVQNLVDLLVSNQFDHVYHEHRYYLSADSIDTIARRHGLVTREVRYTAPQGGSVQVALSHLNVTEDREIHLRDGWLQHDSTYTSVQPRVNRLIHRISDAVQDQLRDGNRLAGYGAPAKATTLLNACALSAAQLDYVVDSSPSKQGRFIPGTGIPIVAPNTVTEPDTYLLLAWNYLGGILQREHAFHQAGGRFLVPLPVPTVL